MVSSHFLGDPLPSVQSHGPEQRAGPLLGWYWKFFGNWVRFYFGVKIGKFGGKPVFMFVCIFFNG